MLLARDQAARTQDTLLMTLGGTRELAEGQGTSAQRNPRAEGSRLADPLLRPACTHHLGPCSSRSVMQQRMGNTAEHPPPSLPPRTTVSSCQQLSKGGSCAHLPPPGPHQSRVSCFLGFGRLLGPAAEGRAAGLPTFEIARQMLSKPHPERCGDSL